MNEQWKERMGQLKKWLYTLAGEREEYISRTEANRKLGEYLARKK
jgi:hypothetical protein